MQSRQLYLYLKSYKNFSSSCYEGYLHIVLYSTCSYLITSSTYSDHKSWSIASRGNFSYSDHPKVSQGNHGTSTVDQPDDILDTRHTPKPDEFDMVQKKNLLNSKLRMAGGMLWLMTCNKSCVCRFMNCYLFLLEKLVIWSSNPGVMSRRRVEIHSQFWA